MTGFYHRRRFLEVLTDRLDEPARGGVRAVAYIRPDKFGDIEDQIGPIASEEILVQIAEQLRSLTQPNDLYGRFGGQVFAMLLERGTLRDIEAWAKNACKQIAAKIFEVAHNTLSATCTIGLAEVGPGNGRHGSSDGRGEARKPARPRARRQSSHPRGNLGRKHACAALRRDLGAGDQGGPHGKPVPPRPPPDRAPRRRAADPIRHRHPHDRRPRQRGAGNGFHARRRPQPAAAFDRPLGNRREPRVLREAQARLRIREALERVRHRQDLARVAQQSGGEQRRAADASRLSGERGRRYAISDSDEDACGTAQEARLFVCNRAFRHRSRFAARACANADAISENRRLADAEPGDEPATPGSGPRRS